VRVAGPLVVHVVNVTSCTKWHCIVNILGSLINLSSLHSIVRFSLIVGFDNVLSQFGSDLKNNFASEIKEVDGTVEVLATRTYCFQNIAHVSQHWIVATYSMAGLLHVL